jgi:hypothetical protein
MVMQADRQAECEWQGVGGGSTRRIRGGGCVRGSTLSAVKQGREQSRTRTRGDRGIVGQIR